MKVKNNFLKLFFLTATLGVLSFSCSNDDDATFTTCTTQGLFYDLGTSPQVFEPEANLTTDFFITSGNGPEVEIYGPVVTFVTTAVNLGDTGTAMLTLNGLATETVAVTCLATGNNVGDTMRFAFNGTYVGDPISGEFCVTIDVVQ